MISKKIVLWISLLGSLYFTSLFFVNVGNYCYYHMWCEKVLSWLDFIGFNIFVFPVILFFSLLTYKMREGVYIYWMKIRSLVYFRICHFDIYNKESKIWRRFCRWYVELVCRCNSFLFACYFFHNFCHSYFKKIYRIKK